MAEVRRDADDERVYVRTRPSAVCLVGGAAREAEWQLFAPRQCTRHEHDILAISLSRPVSREDSVDTVGASLDRLMLVLRSGYDGRRLGGGYR